MYGISIMPMLIHTLSKQDTLHTYELIPVKRLILRRSDALPITLPYRMKICTEFHFSNLAQIIQIHGIKHMY